MAKAVRAEVLSQLRCPVADIRIGVSASGQGATICIMQPYADGSTTTIYSEMHPLGDSMGRATWWAPRKRQCAEGHAEYKLRAMARNYTDRHSWDHLDSDCVMAAADEIRALRAALASAPVSGEEVTDEMVQAGAKAAREYFERTGGNAPAVIYRAMRAAAPAAAQASAEHVRKVRDDAFTAGFICAGGDAEEAKQQAPQFQACIDAGREHNHRRTRADTALPVPLGSLQTAPCSPSFHHPLPEPAKPYDQQDGIQCLRDSAGTVTDVMIASLASLAYRYAMTLSFAARNADGDQVEGIARRVTAKLKDEIRAIISGQSGRLS